MGLRERRPGPVHLSLPTDVLEQAADADRLPGAAAFAARVQPLTASDAKSVLARLRQAKRPLVLAGPACVTRLGPAGERAGDRALA